MLLMISVSEAIDKVCVDVVGRMLRELTSMKMFIRVLALLTVWSFIFVKFCIESDRVRVEQGLRLKKESTENIKGNFKQQRLNGANGHTQLENKIYVSNTNLMELAYKIKDEEPKLDQINTKVNLLEIAMEERDSVSNAVNDRQDKVLADVVGLINQLIEANKNQTRHNAKIMAKFERLTVEVRHLGSEFDSMQKKSTSFFGFFSSTLTMFDIFRTSK